MKRILFFLLVLISLSAKAQANDLKINKATAIEKATKHFNQASEELYKAEQMCHWYIPDVKSRDTIRSLIASALLSTQAKDPRAAILIVVMPILSEALASMNEQFCEMRDSFRRAEHHFHMARIYNNLSLNNSASGNIDEGTKKFFNGIDYLTNVIINVQTLYEREDINVRNSIANHLNHYRQNFLADQTNLWERGNDLYENFNEIAIDLDGSWRRELSTIIYLMVIEFRDAELFWNDIKQKAHEKDKKKHKHKHQKEDKKTRRQREKEEIDEYIRNS